ncbi:MAG: folylpolyglutamate synthase/dihydrofolate synthase family protein [Acidobacteriaceae bacterium]
MSYAQAIESLYARGHELAGAHAVGVADSPPRKFDLAEMRILTAALGSPELKFPSVLIAGTNGKGSTAAMLANILGVAGYRAGLYTSPHLTRVNERVQINGATLSDDDFARLYFRVDETGSRLLREGKLPQHPSFFESVTAVAFLYFAEQAIDIAVLEVGMGGRLDATNIVEPLLSVITDISLDHTEWLGATIDAIAREKAGILRPNGTLVTLPQHPVANQALGEVAVDLNVRGVSAVEYMPPRRSAEEEATRFYAEPYSVTVAGTSVELRPALAGTHQHRNAALAVAAAIELCNSHSYNITPRQIAEGISTARWPGRLELFPRTDTRPAVLLDVAHNPAGAWTLRSALSTWPGLVTQIPTQRTLLFGCLREKAVEEMAQILFPVFDRVILTLVNSPRTASLEELRAVARALGVEAEAAASPVVGMDLAQAKTAANGLIVCAGSVYLVGALRDSLLNPQGKG